MTCGGCARRVTNSILTVDPEAQIVTDPPSREVKVTTRVDEQALLTALVEAGYPAERIDQDRKSVVYGKSVSVRVDLGGRRIIKKQNNITKTKLKVNART